MLINKVLQLFKRGASESLKESKSTFTADCVRKVQFTASKKWTSGLNAQWKQFVNGIEPYPGRFNGKGIVICAGGVNYFTCAWININMLRKNGCLLPIEVWYTGNELNAEAINALEELGVKCKNCQDYTTSDLASYALKPFAILQSNFKEVLYLDADNNCISDPAFLFDSQEYQEYGAMFWPDFWTTDRGNPIWKIIESDDYGSIEQESGQLLVNKEKCWKELNLCMYFNLNRKDYYKMLLGDKDTFRFAWKALRTPYYMVPAPVGLCGVDDPGAGFCGMSMVQHDQSGKILFLHRNWFKWDIMKDDEVMWTTVKRYLPGTDRLFRLKFLTRGDIRLKFLDLDGEVQTISFHELFGDYEIRCLEILKELRASELYSRFLQHTYFSLSRPAYANGHMDNIFASSAVPVASNY
jgi:alpha 1,2-mannosyltransferase